MAADADDLVVPPGATWTDLGPPLRRLMTGAQQRPVVVSTSGSSGTPKRVRLPAAALRASGTGTAERLGGHGQWVLALPTHHVAGLQVLARSALAGTEPVELDAARPFTAEVLAAAVGRLDPNTRRYASLVPTQLHRALADPEGVAALRDLDAVLVGGAATDDALLARARAAGARVVTTYGMSETCGGCVYDGVPLPGVRVEVTVEGRVRLGGPVLAEGYVDDADRTARSFVTDASGRWFLTEDRGVCRAGRLTVLGRVDDVVLTGGHKVEPRDVETALRALPGVRDALVVGVPDAEWGQRVAALVTLEHGPGPPATRRDAGAEQHRGDPPTGADLRAALRRSLPAHAVPRQVEVVDGIPALPTGKPDRAAARRLLDAGGRMKPHLH
ncbi:o-succinylbenzoate--CoA ligase [uncultured Serinicoccus sp.]|uniref:o-succinylbenzoate--CoA ligase n=1 Tax=uncultured Serinicoccus sp. TaxID=735514 RepID=UPI00261D510C|nr:o-succinylbenzoate--CoA ligase [uncultured Serinicoccus sp.]